MKIGQLETALTINSFDMNDIRVSYPAVHIPVTNVSVFTYLDAWNREPTPEEIAEDYVWDVKKLISLNFVVLPEEKSIALEAIFDNGDVEISFNGWSKRVRGYEGEKLSLTESESDMIFGIASRYM